MDKRRAMDGDGDEENPIVPHNSMTLLDCGRSPTSRLESRQKNYPKRDLITPNKRIPKDATDGKEVIESLKFRLYDRPENSEVFRAILRPSGGNVTPHPPPTGAPRPGMGAYRTTMYRRDFKRIQAKRAGTLQSPPGKEPVKMEMGHLMVVPPIKKKRPEVLDNKGPIEKEDLGTADGGISITGAMQEEVGMAHEEKAPSLSSLNSTKDVDFSSEFSAHIKKSRPGSHRSLASSSSLSEISALKRDLNYNKPTPPKPLGLPDDDSFLGLDIMDVIKKLRHRLNRSTDLDAIANGIDIDSDENNLLRLYIKEDDGRFLYCLPKNRGVRAARYNPYDLECVTSSEAKCHSVHFTVTSSAVTQVTDSQSTQLTLIERWLCERRIFNRIKDIPTFRQFRMWKAFTCWKANVRFTKNKSSKLEVGKVLFTNNEVIQKGILDVRELCEKASSSLTGIGTGDDAISLLCVQPDVTYTLEEFCKTQEEHMDKARVKIFALRKKVVVIVKQVCEKVAEMEGLVDWIHPERLGVQVKEKNEIKTLKEIKDKPKDKEMGKDKPTFTQMSQWRTILHRITCFIRLVDFLLMELLRRLVLVGVRTLAAQIKASCTYGDTVLLSLMETTEEEQRELLLKKTDILLDSLEPEDLKAKALLRVALVLNVTSDTHTEPRDTRKKTVSFQDGDGDTTDDDTVSTSTEHGSTMTSKSDRSSVVSQYSTSFITMSPSQEEIENGIFSVIHCFERTVGAFKSLVRDKELSVFTIPPKSDVVYALSRDMDEEEKANKLPWPNTDLLFGEDPDYQNNVVQIAEFVSNDSENVLNYAEKFQRFCKMVDKSRKVNVEASLKEREWKAEEFNAVLNQHTEQVQSMDEMTLFKRVGLFHVESDGFQQSALPYPRLVLTTVAKYLPVLAAKRNDALLHVIKHASRKLDATLVSVEEFVDHLIFLSRMSSEIASLEREYVIVTRLYSIAVNYDIPIEAEENALYKTLMPSFQHLKSTILYCVAKRDENIQFYNRALDELISHVRHDLRTIANKVRSPALLDSENIPQVTIEKLKYLAEELETIATQARNYATYQERFNSSMSSTFHKKALVEGTISGVSTGPSAASLSLQTEVSEVEKDLSLRKLLWEATEKWEVLVERWQQTAFESLSISSVQKDVLRFIETIFMLEKGVPHNKVVPRLKQKVTTFKLGLPVITSLRNPALRTRHWEAIQEAIGKRFIRDRSFTLGHLLRLKVFQHKDRIAEIATQASNEATLEQMLQKVMDFWNQTDFTLSAHATRDIAIITRADDMLAALDESQVTLANIRGSRFVLPIKHLVEEWDRKLTLFSRTLDEWLTCQRNWLYLETIFSAADIQRQLPNEARLFSQVDKSWRDIMRRTIDKPNALKAATAAGVLEVLQASNSHLEKIHRCLEDYLETKRLVFPRFYFLSNEDLFDILANNKNPNAVQPHLRKCFDNINLLDIVRQAHSPPQIKSMISEEGESVHLPKTLRARGNVESWLLNVENAMYETIKMHLKKALADVNNTEYTTWVLSHPGQAIINVCQINFNNDVMNCFKSSRSIDALVSMRNRFVTQLTQLSQLVTTPLSAHQHQMLESLLTIEVHGRDILDLLIKNQVTQQEHFEWSRQLRYEWDDDRSICKIRHCDAVFEYGFEYLGCSTRLVITPLTDRCYLTMTGALNLHLYGAPSGPAGTGKTETVKDLAKAMGKHCLVFNCSEGLDYKMMGKFFSGLSQTGSWICFDEFNRIDVEVLSVIAQQLHSIKAAKDNEVVRFVFEGRDIKMNPSCGVFITMNPGYAGRVDLPDNLKALFRPVSMMVPDYALIAENILFSEGFAAAAMLSRKVFNLYQLSSKQLSQQDHYDFGLRAVKSVLLMAGLERRSADLQNDSENLEEEESHIIINAIRKANLPKLVTSDVPLFNNILVDLFPGVTPPPPDNRKLERAISWALTEMPYQYWPSQIEKIMQIYHTLLVRHGIMLVGPAGGGKTAARQILRRALVYLPTVMNRDHHEKPGEDFDDSTSGKSATSHGRSKLRKGRVEVSCVNPKCLTLGELYGEFDPTTSEWTDGMLSHFYRRYAKDSRGMTSRKRNKEAKATARTPTPSSGRPHSAKSFATMSEEQSEVETQSYADESHMTSIEEGQGKDELRFWHWIVMDGPVDTLWAENLNTVLDDTKVLCLANGERISMGFGMRMIFEVDNLVMASPATVSRCGMVYMDPNDLGWLPYVKTWIHSMGEAHKVPTPVTDHLLALFEHSTDAGLRFLSEHSHHQHIPAPALSVVSTLCGIIGGFIDMIEIHGGFGVAPEKSAKTEDQTEDSQEKTVTFADDFEREIRTRRVSCVQRNPHHTLDFFGKVYVFAYTWAYGGLLQADEEEEDDDHSDIPGVPLNTRASESVRKKFDLFVRDLFSGTGKQALHVALPNVGSDTVFSYYIDLEVGNFAKWDVLVPPSRALIAKAISDQFTHSGHTHILEESATSKTEAEIDLSIVPTLDTIRYAFLLALMSVNKQPVLLTGDVGVGKTVLILDTLTRLSKDGGTSTNAGSILGAVFRSGGKNLVESILEGTAMDKPEAKSDFSHEMIQFSSRTTAARVREFIESKLVKRGREALGPVPGQKAIIFVDDLNMPQPDKFNAQPPLEVVRQFLDSGGFHDTKKLVWKEVFDVTLMAACSPPGGGRSALNGRLLRHFSILSLSSPSTKWLRHIYGTQLGRYLEKVDFTAEVRESCDNIVITAMSLYFKLSTGLLPTPAKTHYTFNLRDLSKVIEGMLQAHPAVISLSEHCAQLVIHESMRVFHDRLVDDVDRSYFFNILSETLRETFRLTLSPDVLKNEPIMFGDFLDSSSLSHHSSSRIYRLANYDRLISVLEDHYDRVRHSWDNMQHRFVFFDMAVQHITRAARVFRNPGNHMMMIGVGGTGKATVAKLAAYIEGCHFMMPVVSRVYLWPEFCEDLKKAVLNAGLKGENTVLFLTDAIVKDIFLEGISTILSSGEIHDLFDHEDLEQIFLELQRSAVRSGIPDTKASVFKYFMQRVKKRLHLVISTSPVGQHFRQNCRLYPLLINCCTIDWYDKWPLDALQSVANSFLELMEFEMVKVDDKNALKKSLAKTFVEVHKSVEEESKLFYEEMQRRYYTTPTTYMEFVKLFLSKFHEKASKFSLNKDRLATGLLKLAESNNLVGVMQAELIELGPQLERKSKDTEKLLEQLARDQKAVDQVHSVVREEEEFMNNEATRIQAIADEAQRDLESVIPELEQAIAALDALDKSDISEIRVYTKPPAMVMTVLSAVCVLLQQKPDWNSAKLLLADPGFLKNLVTYDKHSVPDKVFVRLKRYTQNPNFNPETVGKISVACRSMCQWVLALENYSEVYKMVQPKQSRCEEAQTALAMAKENLRQKQASLATIQEQLEILQNQYDESVSQQEELKVKKELTIARLQRASVLTTELAEEQDRWSQAIKQVGENAKGLIGDALLSTAAITYLGAFTSTYRRGLLNHWHVYCEEKSIPVSDNFELTSFLTEPVEIQLWLNNGLPHDKYSIENGAIIKHCHRWPLLIDPQEQASKWIMLNEKENRLKVVKATDSHFIKTLEQAIPLGEPVLIEDVGEDIDPALNPILTRNTSLRGNHLVICMGDTVIEYNPNFRLYMTSTLANPHFLPDVCIKVTLINFTVTLDGLQDQLLSRVVQQEIPKLEEQRKEILHNLGSTSSRGRLFHSLPLGRCTLHASSYLISPPNLVSYSQYRRFAAIFSVGLNSNERRMGKSFVGSQSMMGPIFLDPESLSVFYRYSLLAWRVQRPSGRLWKSLLPWLWGVKDRFKLEELEDRSLSLLHTSRGNILDDEDLINTLDESIKMAHVIQVRVVESEQTEEAMKFHREKYLPIASRGAILYFVLTDLASIDVMYQFSLPSFTTLFAKCIESSRDAAKQESPIPPGSAGTLRPLKKDKFYPGKRISMVEFAGFNRKMTIPKNKDESDLPEYLKALVDQLTENVYRVVSHAIFARHKLTFSFMLCANILMKDKLKRTVDTKPPITENEWNLFLRGSAIAAIAERIEADDDDEPSYGGHLRPKVSRTKAGGSMGHLVAKMSKSPAKWISESAWKECLQLSTQLKEFAGLCSNITVSKQFWKKFAESSNPYEVLESDEEVEKQEAKGTSRSSKVGWHSKSLSEFQKLMLIKILRPECLVETVRMFVERQLGSKFVTNVGFDLQEIYEESNARTPLIFILSPGSDPASSLIRFAKELRGTTLHLDMISLGRGQEPKAEEAITKAYQQKGKWVFLQNCQHASSFMPRLQQIVKRISMPDTPVDPQFRMWLSSKPDPSFPVSILQVGLKMTVEPPPGIKANLLRTFGAVGGVVTDSVFEDPSAGPAWKRLLFGLCMFNAVVHERKKFSSSLGWNIPYEFSTSDLEVSMQMLHMLLTEHRDVPWQALCYLTGDIAYGGRVTDEWDQRCLKSILKKFYNPDVLLEDYAYTTDHVYRPPPSNISLLVCCSYIDELPASDSAELFGMDQTADTSYLKAQAGSLITDLLAGQPKITGHAGSRKTNDDIVLDLSQDIRSRLLKNVTAIKKDFSFHTSLKRGSSGPDQQQLLKKLKEESTRMKELSSQYTLLVILEHEVQRFDRLLDVIHTSLDSLCLAINGRIVMTSALEQAFNALLNNAVPTQWKNAAYESCKSLGSWVDNLAKRVEFFGRWLELVRQQLDAKKRSTSPDDDTMGYMHPRAYWLPAFFFPQGFLTAVLQTHARTRGIPVDSLSFDYKVRKERWTAEEEVHGEGDIDFRSVAFQGAPPEDGVTIFGLYLDGASWDSNRGYLCETQTSQQRVPLPGLQFIPYQNVEDKPKQDEKQEEEDFEIYDCPVYRTSLRASSFTPTGHPTNFVTSVSLPSMKPADHWITRGVALLCQLDE